MKRVLMITMLVLLLSETVAATEVIEQQAAMLQADRVVDALPDKAKELLGESSPEAPGDLFKKAAAILGSALGEGGDVLRKAAKSAATILLSVMICSVSGIFLPKNSPPVFRLLGVAAIYLVCIADMQSMIGLGKRTVDELSDFTTALLPVMAGAATAAGAVSSSAALYTGSIFFLKLLLAFFQKVLVPMVYFLLALSVANAALEQNILGEMQGFLNRFIKNSLKLVLFAFSAFLSLTHIVSGSADALAVKATKLAVSTIVPVVGGMISDASETVLVSAKLLKNSLGVFGMLAILSILIVPFLKLGLQYVVLQLTSLVSSAIGEKAHICLVKDVASAMGLMLGMVCCCGIMAFLSCVCFMKVTVM